MHKKNYVAIAEVLREEIERSFTDSEKATIARTAVKLAGYFAADNPRFDKARFLDAVRPK